MGKKEWKEVSRPQILRIVNEARFFRFARSQFEHKNEENTR